MSKEKLERGDIVQLSPESASVRDEFKGRLMIVTEPKPWGAQGFVHGAGEGMAYYRVRTEDFDYCGHAVFMPGDEIND